MHAELAEGVAAGVGARDAALVSAAAALELAAEDALSAALGVLRNEAGNAGDAARALQRQLGAAWASAARAWGDAATGAARDAAGAVAALEESAEALQAELAAAAADASAARRDADAARADSARAVADAADSNARAHAEAAALRVRIHELEARELAALDEQLQAEDGSGAATNRSPASLSATPFGTYDGTAAGGGDGSAALTFERYGAGSGGSGAELLSPQQTNAMLSPPGSAAGQPAGIGTP
eukprot:200829-Chlamydomonas_euryale.AAC.3